MLERGSLIVLSATSALQTCPINNYPALAIMYQAQIQGCFRYKQKIKG